MDKENDRMKYKSYTREKTSNSNYNYNMTNENNNNTRALRIKPQDLKTLSHQNSNNHTKNDLAKDCEFENYKINPLKYKYIRAVDIKRKLNNTVNHRDVSPLNNKGNLTPIRLRQNSQMIHNLPSVSNQAKPKSQTPPPTRFTKGKSCYTTITNNKPKQHVKGGSNSNTPQRVSSPSIDTKPNENVKQIIKFRTQILQLNKTIERMKMDYEKNVLKKEEEIGLLMVKLSQKHEEDNQIKMMKMKEKEKEAKPRASNSMEMDQGNVILNQAQQATIELLDIKLKDTQSELEEFKQLTTKQKNLIEVLYNKIRIQSEQSHEVIEAVPVQSEVKPSSFNHSLMAITTSVNSIIINSKDEPSPNFIRKKEKLALVQTIKQSNPICIHKGTLLTNQSIIEISFLLRKIFEVNNLSLETVIYHLFENDTNISFDNIVNKYLIITNNSNPQNRIVLLKYFESLSNDLNEEYANLDLMKRSFISKMQKLRFYSNKEASKQKTDNLINLLLPYREDLEKEFDTKDVYSIGLISHEALGKIIEKLDMTTVMSPIDSEQYEQMVLIMKQFHDENCDIYDLNYRNLLSLLGKASGEAEERLVLISKPKEHIAEWLKENGRDFNEFMKPLMLKMILIEQKRFVYTDDLIRFLKENKVLSDYETIDKQVTTEIIDINDLGEFNEAEEKNNEGMTQQMLTMSNIKEKEENELQSNNAVKDDNEMLTKNFVDKVFEDALVSKKYYY